MKKWFLLSITYSEFSNDTKVEFVSEEDVENALPQSFYASDDSGLQIFELSPDGKKIERNDLSQEIEKDRNKNYYDSLY